MGNRLEDIASAENKAFAMGPFGSNIRAENYRESGIPIIRGTNLTQTGGSPFIDADYAFLTIEKANELSGSKALPSDLVFVAQGTVGKVGLVPENSKYKTFILSQNLMKVTLDKRKADARFVYYYFRSSDGQAEIASYVNPTGVPCISQPLSSLRKFQIPYLPSIDNQKAIAHILGTLDDKIELLRSMNETLEAMARALFKSWFIDFDPVRKKAEGQPTGLPPEIDALFPDSFEDSELGEIPKGWEAVPLSSRFGFLPGYAFKSQDWAESGIPVIKIGSVKPGFVDLSQVSFVSEEIAITANRFRLKVGDLVIGMTGYVGEVGLIPNTKNPPLLNQRVGKFVLTREGTSELGFIYCLTRRKEFKSMVETNSHGTAQANVSSEGIMSIKTVFSKKSIYDAFNAKTQNLFDTLLSNKYEMDILESIRDSLLPKLVSGEIELSDKDISKIMEPVK